MTLSPQWIPKPSMTTQRDRSVRRQLASDRRLCGPARWSPNYRKCGKPNCHCASRRVARGHGPQLDR